MIESYAFLAAFAAQIFVGSILSPSRMIKYVRGWARSYGSERFATLYPEIDYDGWVRRFVGGFRAAHVVTALVGVALLVWMLMLIREPHWTGRVSLIATIYFMFQLAPLVLTSLYVFIRYWKFIVQPPQEAKRKATLQRRGLLDYVSPAAVVVWIASWPLFVAYSIWLDLYVYDNATLSKECLTTLISISFVYALNGFIVYKSLYSRRNPLMSTEGRTHSISVQVKSCVYTSIAVAWFMVLFGTLGQPSLTEWRPFTLTLFFVLCTLLTMAYLYVPSSKSDVDGLATPRDSHA